MGGEEDPFLAAAAILKNLARDPPPTDDDTPKKRATNGFDPKCVVKLPGENTPGKKAFTAELESLMCRVHDLETELVSCPNSLALILFYPFLIALFHSWCLVSRSNLKFLLAV